MPIFSTYTSKGCLCCLGYKIPVFPVEIILTSMPVPLSVKVAITVGALVGGTVAVVQNRETILDVAETAFQAGARFCREKKEKLKQANMAFADEYEYGSWEQGYEEETRRGPSSGLSSGFSSGITTPGSSDDEEEEEEMIERRVQREYKSNHLSRMDVYDLD